MHLWILLLCSILCFSGCARQESKGKIELKWSGYAYPAYDKFRSEESKKFEKIHPEVVVKYEPVPGDFRSKILTQLAGGTAPDVFFVPLGDISGFAKRGTLVDLTPYIEKDRQYFSKIHPLLMKAQTYKGRYYALPGNCGTNLLYYNKGLFDEAGLKYPDGNWTWKDMLEAAKKLTKQRNGGKQYGLLIPGYMWLFMIYSNGGRVWNEDMTKCIINSKESRQTIDYIRDAFVKYKVSPSPYEMREQGGGEQFIRGNVAMYMGNSWEIATIGIRSYGSKVKWDAIMVPPPEKGKRRMYELQYNSLGVCLQSKNPELAYELAKFMIESERVKFLVEVGDSLPMRKEGAELEYYLKDPNRTEKCREQGLKALQYVYDWADYWNPHIPYSEQQVIFDQNFEKFYLDEKISSDKILSEIEEKLNSLLKVYKSK